MHHRSLLYLSLVGSCLSTQEILEDILRNSSLDYHQSDGPHRAADMSLAWHPPKQTWVNNLTSVLGSSGTYGFIFDSSETPSSLPYHTYNWCNMPHLRKQEYPIAPGEYKLEYVEVIHRHHKRTPYASNMFPGSEGIWNCDDETLFYYGALEPENNAVAIGWQVYTSPSNPFGDNNVLITCQFPQISAGGLLDSRQHGRDLFGVYHDLLQFLPDTLDTSRMDFRVTNNQITSQVAGQVILGMYPGLNHDLTKVWVQPPSIDSLEPKYPCPKAASSYSSLSVGGNDSRWRAHLQDELSKELFAKLDTVSGIASDNYDWHKWFDHYFDNLSARTCHAKGLPCNKNNSSLCITQEDADAVFRRGEYEYSFIYRDSRELFEASVATFGVWVAELADNLRRVMAGDRSIYRHNFAHDGSISRLLSILQVDTMVWPGMGSEVVFELYSKTGEWFLRVFWAGQILTSSNPSLGKMDMLPVDTFVTYVDGLVGQGAHKLPKLCSIANLEPS